MTDLEKHLAQALRTDPGATLAVHFAGGRWLAEIDGTDGVVRGTGRTMDEAIAHVVFAVSQVRRLTDEVRKLVK